MRTTPGIAVRELDRRTNEGIDVTLLWDAQTNRVSVAVADERTGEFLDLEVEPADALTAFRHPYAYANRNHTVRALAA